MAKEGGLGFEITELRLGLPGVCSSSLEKNNKKRVFSEIVDDENSSTTSDHKKLQIKNQIVGWPPVCSYRKKKNDNVLVENKTDQSDSAKMYIKVSMDGAPYLRKIDLSVYEGYSDLTRAFQKLFTGGAWKDIDSSEYIPIYEDKEGDWMLVGDVPWTMFTESCKRLRIMKRSDVVKGFGLPVENYEPNGFNKM